MSRRASFANDERGAAAVEFALVVPLFALVLFAIFHLCFVTYATSSLHWVVEQTARCAAVGQINTGVSCGTTKASAQSYAAAIYKGPLVGPTFTATEITDSTTGYCRQVSGQGTYRIILGWVNVDVPVSAQACFPEQNTGAAWS